MFGTGDFAAPTFHALLESGHAVVALVTQPPRPSPGRRGPPRNLLRELAVDRGLPVIQPEKINTPESLAQLRQYAADLFVVAAYGQILSRELLAIPARGSINVHSSLLPKYRGAAPISAAILSGDVETGVTVQQVVFKLDAGPILGMVRTPISPTETTGELEERLSRLGATLAVDVVNRIAAGTAVAVPQDESAATYVGKLKKADGEMDWTRSAVALERQVRGMQPWPMAWTLFHKGDKPPQRVLVIQAAPVRDTGPNPSTDSTPGTVVASPRGRLLVQTGDGLLEILKVQPEAKRTLTAAEFVNGYRATAGDRFGS
jgi:methionyl-tRNA formyltransferase